MGPDTALPLPEGYHDSEEYVNDLLNFVSTSDLLQQLCGGVHILDFFTREPDLYESLLDREWREWFELHELPDLLDFILREDVSPFLASQQSRVDSWRGQPAPPAGFADYINQIRRLTLRRDFTAQDARDVTPSGKAKIHPRIAVGMKVKKVHEVDNFARYVHRLKGDVESQAGEVTHLVDFGSGQNYLGRTLASEPYNAHVLAVEGRPHNVESARRMDVSAKVTPKTKPLPEASRTAPTDATASTNPGGPQLDRLRAGKGSVQYVQHQLQSGDLAHVVASIPTPAPRLMVISLHSCGNLLHHGLRSLTLNPSVVAVALVGCCYNLLTERLGPPTYKMPSLRPPRDRHKPAADPSTEGDPHGFPLSARLAATPGLRLNITARMMAVQAPHNWSATTSASFFRRHFYRALLQRVLLDAGVVEAPAAVPDGGRSPAGGSECARGGATQPVIVGSLRKAAYESFEAYVRSAAAKLGCASPSGEEPEGNDNAAGKSDVARNNDPAAHSEAAAHADATPPSDPRQPPPLTSLHRIPAPTLTAYAATHAHREKQLSVVWTLMAYSAGLVEAAIVVDRWLWLREQAEVQTAWVEGVFGYGVSPRNLVVVGVKKGGGNCDG